MENERLTRLEKSIVQIEGNLAKVIARDAERKSGGYRIGTGETPRRWHNPNVARGQVLRVLEWWRGKMLTGSDSDSLRRKGREHMERALPGADEEYNEWLAEQDRLARLDSLERAVTSSAEIVPTVLSPFIDHVRAEPSYLGDLAQVVEMGSGSHKVPKETPAIAAANYDEDTAISVSEPTVGSTTLTATKGAAIQHVSIETVQDASPDVIGHLLRRTLESVDELETAQGLEGDGTGDNFTGVKIASSVNEVDLANGGAALADLDLLAEMVTAIPAAERDPVRCAWFVSSDGYRALLQIQDAAGANPMLGQNPRELFGFKIILTDQIATTSGTPDTSTVYFGNWRGVALGRRGMDMLDVVPYGGTDAAFNKAQVSLRVIRRYAVAVHLASLLVRGINLYVAA
jgi:HK97 family phage major capsid protein